MDITSYNPKYVADTAGTVVKLIPDSTSVPSTKLGKEFLKELEKNKVSLQSYQQQASELIGKPLTEVDQISLRYWMTMIRKTEQTLVLFSLLKEKR